MLALLEDVDGQLLADLEPLALVAELAQVTQGRVARGLGKFTGVARVNGAVVAEAEMMCALREIDEATGGGR